MAKATEMKPAMNGIGLILTAISNITEKIGSLEKHGENKEQNYAYAKAADLMAKLQPLLVSEGLIIMPSEVSHSVLVDSVLASTYEFTIGHKSGVVWPDKPRFTGISRLVSRNGSVDDKAGNKTLTAASKYFAINLFKIPTIDADDADADGTPGKLVVAPEVEQPKQAAAPVDAKPHTIKKDGKSWIDWGSEFIAAIDTAQMPDEVAQWEIANSSHLVAMGKESPKAKARLVERIKNANQRAADTLLILLNSCLAECKDEKGLTAIWQRMPAIGHLRKDDHDRAVTVYENHKARVVGVTKDIKDID